MNAIVPSLALLAPILTSAVTPPPSIFSEEIAQTGFRLIAYRPHICSVFALQTDDSRSQVAIQPLDCQAFNYGQPSDEPAQRFACVAGKCSGQLALNYVHHTGEQGSLAKVPFTLIWDDADHVTLDLLYSRSDGEKRTFLNGPDTATPIYDETVHLVRSVPERTRPGASYALTCRLTLAPIGPGGESQSVEYRSSFTLAPGMRTPPQVPPSGWSPSELLEALDGRLVPIAWPPNSDKTGDEITLHGIVAGTRFVVGGAYAAEAALNYSVQSPCVGFTGASTSSDGSCVIRSGLASTRLQVSSTVKGCREGKPCGSTFDLGTLAWNNDRYGRLQGPDGLRFFPGTAVDFLDATGGGATVGTVPSEQLGVTSDMRCEVK